MQAAPLLRRGAMLLAGLWLAVRALPVLPDPIAALMVVALGCLIALPWAWARAVNQAFNLARFRPEGRLRPALEGAFLRVVVLGPIAALAAALLLLRLVEAGPVQWVLVGLALPLTWGLMGCLAPWAGREQVGLHARRLVHRVAAGMAVAGLVALSALAGWLLPVAELPPFAAPAGAGPLVAEALAFTRLWAGVESFALGQAGAFGGWGRGVAVLVSVAGQAAVFAAAATLAVALALPRREWLRALGPASESASPPLAGRVGPAAASMLAVALVLAAMGAGRWLETRVPEARPSAQMMEVAERIGGAFYRPGTQAQIAALRARASEQDAMLAADLAQAMTAGFDAMEDNVDDFLDQYYSLTAEYLRLVNWFFLRLEAHLQSGLSRALTEGGALQAAQDLLERAVPEVQARHEALRAAEADLLVRNRIVVENPALLRMEGSFEPLPELSGRFAHDLQAAQRRWAGAGGAGLLTAAIASRVAQRLAARGVLRMAARGLVRVAGLLVAVGMDYALIRLDEAENREAFRAEIMDEIDRLRRQTMAALPQPE